ncbi:hypothetical protein Drorol1_Dr00024846 [Drosera rotundifolia]
MDLSEGWKSLFPIGIVYQSIATPDPTLRILRDATLQPYTEHSTSTVVAVTLETNHHRDSSAFDHTYLEKLCCPNGHVIVFFATRKDLDHFGFVVLVPENEGFRVELDVAGKVSLSVNKFDRRINSSIVDHEWASEEGFGILVGSFWNDECSLFCYGPHPPSDVESPSSAESKSGNSFYAWELPSHISLSGRECCCGTCLLRLEFAKDNLLEWIEWQQKKGTGRRIFHWGQLLRVIQAR